MCNFKVLVVAFLAIQFAYSHALHDQHLRNKVELALNNYLKYPVVYKSKINISCILELFDLADLNDVVSDNFRIENGVISNDNSLPDAKTLDAVDLSITICNIKYDKDHIAELDNKLLDGFERAKDLNRHEVNYCKQPPSLFRSVSHAQINGNFDERNCSKVLREFDEFSLSFLFFNSDFKFCSEKPVEDFKYTIYRTYFLPRSLSEKLIKIRIEQIKARIVDLLQSVFDCLKNEIISDIRI